MPCVQLVLNTQNAIDWTVTGAVMVNINYNKLWWNEPRQKLYHTGEWL